MKKHHILYIAITALTLGGCSSAGNSLANAITDPFTPKEGGYRQLSNIGSDEFTRTGLLPGAASKIQVTDDQFIGTSNHEKEYSSRDSIQIGHKRQNAFTALPYVLKNAANQEIENGVLEVYKQSYSAVVGAQLHNRIEPGHQATPTRDFYVRSIQGEFTSNLPTQGIINYKGRAMAGSDNKSNGLNYQIDYGARRGHGSITGLNGFGNIDLADAPITQNPHGHNVINGAANSATHGAGNYELGIFGPQANEIAGKAHFNNQPNKEVGFAGGRVN